MMNCIAWPTMSNLWEGKFHSTSRMSAGLVGGALDNLQIQEKSFNLLVDGSASGSEAVIYKKMYENS